jgi:hypothetical protein
VTTPTYRAEPPIDDFKRVQPLRENDTTVPNNGAGSTVPQYSNPTGPGGRAVPPDGFERPRGPAPIEPNPGANNPEEVLPFNSPRPSTRLQTAPLNLEAPPVASLKLPRERVLTSSGYEFKSLTRLPAAPAPAPVLDARGEQLARR